MRVFISYCDSDGLEIAERAAALLERHRHKAWYYSRDKTPGVIRMRDIASNMGSCKVVMMLWTAGSKGSRGQEKEIGLWDSLDKTLIVLPIDDAQVSREVAGYNYERLRSRTFDSEFENKIAMKLTSIVKRIMKLSGTPRVGARGLE
jgi:hypothetical protein